MFGFGTTAGLTLTVFATSPPTPPSAAANSVSPSRDVGPAAVKTGLGNDNSENPTEMSAMYLQCIFIRLRFTGNE
jgi:hypothetical protein